MKRESKENLKRNLEKIMTYICIYVGIYVYKQDQIPCEGPSRHVDLKGGIYLILPNFPEQTFSCLINPFVAVYV